ncbi:MAG: FAD-binding domain-containing protein [Ilumatobacteraceae bacterium]
MPNLPTPTFDSAADWVAEHLGHLVCDPGVEARPARRGGQAAADAALAALDITGYAKQRNQVHPARSRGATVLSPYVRHGLITLAEAEAAVRTAPAADRRKFVDELHWQEYTRHLYARVGTRNRAPLRRQPTVGSPRWPDPIDDEMVCLSAVRDELEQTGWLVNQTRMWVASHWSVRAGHDWREGEEWMFRHLLDGSRAANRYGWQWSVGSMTAESYGFSRWQVERRSRQWCASCPLATACPIEEWPDAPAGHALDDALLRSGPDLVGPAVPVVTGTPEAVWLTAESLGTRDPALAAWPAAVAIFVFDEPLLARLRLSAKRLVFLAETLAVLAEERPLRVLLGDPVDELTGTALASTFAPVPGYRERAARLDVVATHPYPWLTRPDGGDVRSHSTWARRGGRQTSR